MDKKEVIVIGAGGHAKVIIDILQLLENESIKIKGILDDSPNAKKTLGVPVIGTTQDIEKYRECYFILAIGNNAIRKKIAEEYSDIKYITAIHPKAIISKHAIMEEGTVVMAGAIINPESKIGKHCIINTSAVIEHDCVLEDFVHISPNATLAGEVHIGESTWIGAGATVIQQKKIGKQSIIGAGSVVIRDIPNDCLAIGVPAKITKNL